MYATPFFCVRGGPAFSVFKYTMFWAYRQIFIVIKAIPFTQTQRKAVSNVKKAFTPPAFFGIIAVAARIAPCKTGRVLD
ncbi:hypothetical protein D5272_00320 [bacterium D16-76]|nr:hypothetical protein [bacterium D16-76]